MKSVAVVVVCALGLFVNYCEADQYRDRDFNDRERDFGDHGYHDRDRERERERERERDRNNNRNDNNQSLYCKDLNPQNQLDMEHITGMWFGSEIITHHDTLETDSLRYACVIIHLSEITNQMSTIRPITSDSYNNRQRAYYNSDLQRQEQSYNHYLRLIWDEMGTDIDYTLRYNTSRPGFWLFSEPQRGVMLQINHSKFSGTVQVMKAVGDHMVLTFCQGLPSSELYSIVLSRRPDTLTYDDIQGVRSLLKRRGLAARSVRKICKNGATSMALSTTVVLFAMAAALIWNKIE